MKTLTYTFAGLTLYGLGMGHLGGALLSLLMVGMCWYGARAMDKQVHTVVDKDCDIVCASSLVLAAQYADNM